MSNGARIALKEQPIEPEVDELEPWVDPGPPPLSFKHIVWGVFLGMWMFAITAGIVYGVFSATNH